ncbi:MAG TPA: serine hydrolase [Gemmatimonadaceae bacterium]|nr:serine hydrolase [Gemmatimonadaceae bacterium]
MHERRVRSDARALVAVALTLLLAAHAGAQRPSRPAAGHADTAALRRTLDSLAGAHHGVVGYAVRNLDTGEQLSRRGDETFPTASLIKVAILVTVYDLVETKQISLDDPLTLLDVDKVGGSGVLQYIHGGTTLSVRDAAQLMTMVSDNTATNLLLDRIAIRRVWAKMDSLGLKNTRVHHKVMLRTLTSVVPDSSNKYGLGKTTPNEMAQLFGFLAQGKAVSPRADSAMLAMLETNDDEQMLQRYLEGIRAAHKTGADDEVRTECALFYLRSKVVACVLTKQNVDQRWLIDNEPQLLLARMGAEIVRAWGPPDGGKVAVAAR